MFKYLSSIRKSRKLLMLGIIVVILFALTVEIMLSRQSSSEEVAEPILKISYCGVDLEELCILSFGVDQEENMVINLFVPDRNFPDFYLKIKTRLVDSMYTCEKSKVLPASVFCTGESIGLREKMEISLITKENDQLLAFGNLTLLAILLSPSGGVGWYALETPSANADNGNFSEAVTATTISYPENLYP